ncbi:hypothetical protein VP01_692g1 [Puccinia sorghi]|uniref:Uncharacterized protein n=1 Tax=Puccinia sorghi TaxID=27349 RepID=A0A0L6UE21_9BASI|nr:hypothetical protein VP01_692g1 [Puccinia sorghi]
MFCQFSSVAVLASMFVKKKHILFISTDCAPALTRPLIICFEPRYMRKRWHVSVNTCDHEPADDSTLRYRRHGCRNRISEEKNSLTATMTLTWSPLIFRITSSKQTHRGTPWKALMRSSGSCIASMQLTKMKNWLVKLKTWSVQVSFLPLPQTSNVKFGHINIRTTSSLQELSNHFSLPLKASPSTKNSHSNHLLWILAQISTTMDSNTECSYDQAVPLTEVQIVKRPGGAPDFCFFSAPATSIIYLSVHLPEYWTFISRDIRNNAGKIQQVGSRVLVTYVCFANAPSQSKEEWIASRGLGLQAVDDHILFIWVGYQEDLISGVSSERSNLGFFFLKIKSSIVLCPLPRQKAFARSSDEASQRYPHHGMKKYHLQFGIRHMKIGKCPFDTSYAWICVDLLRPVNSESAQRIIHHHLAPCRRLPPLASQIFIYSFFLSPSHLVRLLCGWEAKHKLSTPIIHITTLADELELDLIASCLRTSFRLIHSGQVPGVCSINFRLNSDNGTGSGDSLRATIMFLYCQVAKIYLPICVLKPSREHSSFAPLHRIFPYAYPFQLKTAQHRADVLRFQAERDSGAEGARITHQQRLPIHAVTHQACSLTWRSLLPTINTSTQPAKKILFYLRPFLLSTHTLRAGGVVHPLSQIGYFVSPLSLTPLIAELRCSLSRFIPHSCSVPDFLIHLKTQRTIYTLLSQKPISSTDQPDIARPCFHSSYLRANDAYCDCQMPSHAWLKVLIYVKTTALKRKNSRIDYINYRDILSAPPVSLTALLSSYHLQIIIFLPFLSWIFQFILIHFTFISLEALIKSHIHSSSASRPLRTHSGTPDQLLCAKNHIRMLYRPLKCYTQRMSSQA